MMQQMVTVRDWQSDRQRGGDGPWKVRDGIVVVPGTPRTAGWAVQLVLSCQRARATEAC